MPTPQNRQASNPLNGTRAVAFDCYGTLRCITIRSSPHPLLLDRLNLTAHQRAQAARLIMTQRVRFRDVPALFGCSLPLSKIDALAAQMHLETATTELYEEVPEVIAKLKASGIKRALVSNSAEEYGLKPRMLLDDSFDVELWSFDVGEMKSDPIVCSLLCERSSIRPQQILMVGDRLEDDVLGTRRAGLKVLPLDRSATGRNVGTSRNLRELTECEQMREQQ